MARKKRLTANSIIDKVEAHHEATEPLRRRMEEDFQLYRLDPYDAGDGFQSYTSNEPSTFADKVVDYLVGSEMVIRVPNTAADQGQREANNMKERFMIGVMKSADERQKMALRPSIKDVLSWQISVRGWFAGRSLLRKDVNGKTIVDITPWDALHTYWGTSDNGLEWACYRIRKSKTDIEQSYNVRLDGSMHPNEDYINMYDYYDKEVNMVVLENGRVIKKATPHGSPRVPVFISPVGSTPQIQALNEQGVTISDTIADMGESVFKHNRDSYEKHNFMMSVMLELTARARKQGLKIISRDGSKTLDEDPYKEGTEISLASGEDIQPLGMLEASKETGAYLALVSGEMQRGGFPHSFYGALPFELSGFAINTLRQGITGVIQPRLSALEEAFKQALMLICDQYVTGAFASMELTGQDMNRDYFKEEISPEVVEIAGDMELKFVGQLPQDDMSKMSMAQIARDGQTPLLSDIYIRDRILGLQDTDEIDASIKEQQGERLLPEATLLSMVQAAERRGRDDLAQIYVGELVFLLQQKLMQRQQAQQQAMQPQQPPQQNGARGIDPRSMPNAMRGTPPPAPTPPQGMVAPNTPRPNARNNR